MNVVKSVVIVGGGTAGFTAAAALRTTLPDVRITILRSPELGIIGVGEGSGPPLVNFLHAFLKIPLDQFIRATQPGIKLGTCFAWGHRKHFFFPFGGHMELTPPGLSRNTGYYLAQTPDWSSPAAALMAHNRAFHRNMDGTPRLHPNFAYHVENSRYANFLESLARAGQVEIRDATVTSVKRNPDNAEEIDSLTLADGSTVSADLYVDCSGFASLLLGKTLGEPFISYSESLICDRAIVSGWKRKAGEPMLAYTKSETMDHGWSWQIDHPDRINRGYVYSSAFTSDSDAEAEFRKKNPRLTGDTRIVRFRSGRYKRSWVGNVVAIGNASGFVEPLEATSLVIIATRCQILAEELAESECAVAPPMKELFNKHTAQSWDSIQRFLRIHYRFNRRLDTPFWQHCRGNCEQDASEPLIQYYQHSGPSVRLSHALLDQPDLFGVPGALAIMTGLGVPYRTAYRPSETEWANWGRYCRNNCESAKAGITVEEVLGRYGCPTAMAC